MTSIEELMRSGRIQRGSEIPRENKTSTGIEDLDRLIGGWEPGFNLITGLAGTGKSLICAMTMANILEKGQPVVVVDTEDSYTLWQNHLPALDSAWNIQSNRSPLASFGFNFANTYTEIANTLAVATQNGTPAKAVVIDCLDGLLLRNESQSTMFQTLHRAAHGDENTAWRTFERFIQSMHRLGLHYGIPIIATKHDYEHYQGLYSATSDLDAGERTNISLKTEEEKNIDTVLSSYAQKSLYTSPYNVYEGQTGLNNTPFITAGNSHGHNYFDYITNWDTPTSFILGVTSKNITRVSRDAITPVAVPFADLQNFEYIAPTSAWEEARANIYNGIYWGDDSEPEDWATGATDSHHFDPHDVEQDQLPEEDRKPSTQYSAWQ